MGKFIEALMKRDADSSERPTMNYIIKLPRYTKRIILMSVDFLLLCFALWASFSLRLGVFYQPASLALALVLLSGPLIAIFCFHYNGLYKLITRFAGRSGALKIFSSIGFSILIWCLLIYMSTFGLASVPRSVIVMYGLFSVLFTWGFRSFIAFFLRDFVSFKSQRKPDTAVPVMIYGVGELGDQLFSDLLHSPHYKMVGFIDDNESLWRQMFHGVRVHNPENIISVVEEKGVREIFLAASTITRRQKRQLINLLAPYSVQVKTLPAHYEIASGKVLISDLRNIGIEDLLGRPAVPPIDELLKKNIQGKCVMITGAGGSIGSEIARQVVQLEPTRIILYELSEFALYEIEYELRQAKSSLVGHLGNGTSENCEIISILGSVLDDKLLRNTIKTYGVKTLYHAAAYKHVPIVEDNPFIGLRNNVFGTLKSARAANDNGVELFVLISTDKAVRPTNVMGASKRIAELCLQSLAEQSDTRTIFTMVRFGNVLGSSGSVIGRFKEQIIKGGPITVTHPDIIRYFMMIPEAAQLVIQAGGLAGGGDVFVLDMGQPIKIVDLARGMINLSGLEVADDENPDGDIAIEFVGLREGEKLFEELLISENSTTTEHSSIIKNHENLFAPEILEEQLDRLESSIECYDNELMQQVLCKLVEGYGDEEQSKLLTRRNQDGTFNAQLEGS